MSIAIAPCLKITETNEVMLRAYRRLDCEAMEDGTLNGPWIVTPYLTTVFPGSVRAQLPPCSAARSYYHRTCAHPLYRILGDKDATFCPGTSAVVITTSDIPA